MKDLVTHGVLFLVLSAVIVLLGTFYAEPDDARALRSYPRRLLYFLLGCGALAGLMLLAEHTLASVS
jgi:hypothetical protein